MLVLRSRTVRSRETNSFIDQAQMIVGWVEMSLGSPIWLSLAVQVGHWEFDLQS